MRIRSFFASSSLIPAAGLLVLAGVIANAHPAMAQTDGACPPPPGVKLPPTLQVTAQQVEDDSAPLREFGLEARNWFGRRSHSAVSRPIRPTRSTAPL